MEIQAYQISTILRTGVELGVITALIKSGLIRPYLKKSEAFKIYGRNKIEKWIDAGLLTPRKDGDSSAAWRLERLEIEVLNNSCNLLKILQPFGEDECDLPSF